MSGHNNKNIINFKDRHLSVHWKCFTKWYFFFALDNYSKNYEFCIGGTKLPKYFNNPQNIISCYDIMILYF